MKKKEEHKIDYDSFTIPDSVKELRPKMYKEGDDWCVSSGEDIASGIFGYGKTPQKAIEDFDANYAKIKENSM
jgi:hypothetical protein